MENIGSLFVRVVNDENNKVEDWINEHVEILLGLFFTKNVEILNEVFKKLYFMLKKLPRLINEFLYSF